MGVGPSYSFDKIFRYIYLYLYLCNCMNISNTYKALKSRVRVGEVVCSCTPHFAGSFSRTWEEMLHNVVVLNRAYTLRETLTHFWYYFLLLHTTIKTTWACLGRLNVIYQRRYKYYALMKKMLTNVYVVPTK